MLSGPIALEVVIFWRRFFSTPGTVMVSPGKSYLKSFANFGRSLFPALVLNTE